MRLVKGEGEYRKFKYSGSYILCRLYDVVKHATDMGKLRREFGIFQIFYSDHLGKGVQTRNTLELVSRLDEQSSGAISISNRRGLGLFHGRRSTWARSER